MPKIKKKLFHEFFRYLCEWWWMKIHPLEVFWAPHHGQKARLAKKTHNFRPLRNLPIFYWTSELHSIFSHLWSTSVDLNFYVIKKPQSSPTQRYCNFGIFVSYVVLQIFAFSCTDTARPDFEITTFIWAYWGPKIETFQACGCFAFST